MKGRDLFAVLPTGYGNSLSLAAFPASSTSVGSTQSLGERERAPPSGFAGADFYIYIYIYIYIYVCVCHPAMPPFGPRGPPRYGQT